MSGLTEGEQKKLLELLSKLESGFYELDLFHEFARLMTIATAIIVPIYVEDGNVNVVTYRRPENDLFWPNKLDVPGCVVRPTDTEQDALKRIIEQEIGLESGNVAPVYAATDIRKTRRGNEVATVYYALVPTVPDNSVLCKPTHLPDDFIELDTRAVKNAVAAYSRDALYSDQAASAE